MVSIVGINETKIRKLYKRTRLAWDCNIQTDNKEYTNLFGKEIMNKFNYK